VLLATCALPLVGACNGGGSDDSAVQDSVTEPVILPEPFAVFEGEAPLDHAGLSFASGDFDGTGDVDLAFGTLFATPPGGDLQQGVAYMVLDPAEGTSELSAASYRLWNGAGVMPSNMTVTAGDMDGDGRDDLLLGDVHSSTSGAAFLVLMPLDDDRSFATADRIFMGISGGEHAGVSVAPLGDVDGDGVADLAIGGHKAVNAGATGAVYVVSDPLAKPPRNSLADAASAVCTAEMAKDFLGFQVAGPGDVDGDGFADLLMGAPAHASEGPYGGAAYLVLGPGTSGVASEVAAARLVGETGANVGLGLAGVGDINSDGYRDLAITAYGDGQGGDDAGAVYLFFGPSLPSGSIAQADATLLGEHVEGRLGFSLDGGRDVNGDGVPDLVVGAPRASVSAEEGGAVYVAFGPLEGVGEVSGFGRVLPGLEAGGQLGSAVRLLGDMDGDGRSEVGVGVVGASGRAGAYHLFHGGDL